MRWLVLGGIAGPLLISLVATVAASLRPGYSHAGQFISELGATGTPNAALLNYGAFIPGGLLFVAFGIASSALWPPTRRTRIASGLIVLFGAGVAVCGVFACDEGCPQTGGSLANLLHDRIAPLSFLCLIVAIGLLGLHFRQNPGWRSFARGSLVTSGLGLIFLIGLGSSLASRDGTGVWQRLLVATLFLWCGVTSVRGFRLLTTRRG